MNEGGIESLLYEIASKRLKGQWSSVLKACEKLARLCDMGLRQHDMVDKKLRVAYWTAMAETKIEQQSGADLGGALSCLKEATKSDLQSDSVEWVEWRIILAKYLLASTGALMAAAGSSVGLSGTGSINANRGRVHAGHQVGVGEEELKPEDVFKTQLTEDLKLSSAQRRMLFGSLAWGEHNRGSPHFQVGQYVLRVLDMMYDESRAQVMRQVLSWMEGHDYTGTGAALTPAMSTKAMSVWTFTIVRELLSNVSLEGLVLRLRSYNGRDYSAWLHLDAVLADASLSVELDQPEQARDRLKAFLTCLFPAGEDVNMAYFPSMVKSAVVDAIARLPILEVALGNKGAALEAYHKCINGDSSVRAHIPVPTQVGMIFSSALILLSEEVDRQEKEEEAAAGGKLGQRQGHGQGQGQGKSSSEVVVEEEEEPAPALNTAYSLLLSIRNIMTTSVITDFIAPPLTPVPAPTLNGGDEDATAVSMSVQAESLPAPPTAGAGSLPPIQMPKHSILSMLPLNAMSPVVETEFVTPGRIGVILYVLMKKLRRGLDLDMLEWSSNHEIMPDIGLLWSLGCAYASDHQHEEALAMLLQCHEASGKGQGASTLDTHRQQELTRVVQWLDPLPRPQEQPWLPILLASRMALDDLSDADRAIALVSQGFRDLFPSQSERMCEVCDVSESMRVALQTADTMAARGLPREVERPEELPWEWTMDALAEVGRPADACRSRGFRELVLVTVLCYAAKSRDSGAAAAVRRVYRHVALALVGALVRGLKDSDADTLVTGESTCLRAAVLVQRSRLHAECGFVPEALAGVVEALTLTPGDRLAQHLHVLLLSAESPLDTAATEGQCREYLIDSPEGQPWGLRLTLAYLCVAAGDMESGADQAHAVAEVADAAADHVHHNTGQDTLARLLVDCSRVLRAAGRLRAARDTVARAWQVCSHGIAVDPDAPHDELHPTAIPELLRQVPQADGWRLPLGAGWASFDTRASDVAALVLTEYAAVLAVEGAAVSTIMDVHNIALAICPASSDAMVGQVGCLLDLQHSEGLGTSCLGSKNGGAPAGWCRAHELASSALRMDDADPACWHALGRCREALGDREGAAETFSAVLDCSYRWGLRGWNVL
jgi:hypothetical protein